MIEIYILLAVISNIIADLLIWREVKRMRISHETIMKDTNALLEGFREFAQTLGGALTDHAKLTAKSLGSAIGYYQGKAEKATEGQIDSIQSTLGALAPLANLVSSNAKSSGAGGPKYHV